RQTVPSKALNWPLITRKAKSIPTSHSFSNPCKTMLPMASEERSEICKKIVTRREGKIKMLPTERAPLPEQNMYRTQPFGTPALKPVAHMERILVVEDDRAVQKALKRLFEAEGLLV